SLRPDHSRPLCGGRNGRRAVLRQLCQRDGPDVGRDLWPAGGAQRRGGRAAAGPPRSAGPPRCRKGRPLSRCAAPSRRNRALAYDGRPDAALEWAKTGILDTVGVTLAGSAEPCAQIMLRVCTATGPALVFGSAQRLSVTDAALVNGTASHALDFDDCSN